MTILWYCSRGHFTYGKRNVVTVNVRIQFMHSVVHFVCFLSCVKIVC